MQRFRLGIMGGTFDPIHYGHLVTAEQAREALNLDKVLFMPTGKPVRKEHIRKVTSGFHRKAMVEAAIKTNTFFEISTLELERDKPTYTVDTLRELKEIYPENVDFYFITGADAIIDILTWHDPTEIAKLATFIAATRPGYNLDEARILHEKSEYQFDVRYIVIPALSISSTYLRKRISEGSTIRYLTHPDVISYIDKHKLYQKDDKE